MDDRLFLNAMCTLQSKAISRSFMLASLASWAMAIAGCANRPEPPREAAGLSKDTRPVARPARRPAPCTREWNEAVDERLRISDASGHGPDLGSAEWMNAVGKKSGVSDGSGHGPDAGSDEWCRAVDYKVFGRR